jgi:VIT1/CCC1 family predicted Fe2+/Mn2+ transporter
VAFFAALAAALLGGYLAVARVAGSAWMLRRHGNHGTEGFGILRSVAAGLAILLAVWLPVVVFGWVPVAGTVLTWTAAVTTWALMTTGFGAAILTRGGVRTTFGRRFAPPILPPATLFEEPGPEISTAEWLGGKQQ